MASLSVVTSAGLLGVSIGLAKWLPGLSVPAWLEKTDDTLYQATAGGRARVALN